MENIDWTSVLIQVGLCWFCYRLGQASVIRALTKDLLEALQKQGFSVGKDDNGAVHIQKDEIVIDIERVDSQYFVYKDSGEFVAQGADFKSLFDTIKTRFPDQDFRINKNTQNLSEEELAQLMKTIFEVYGNKENTGDQRR
jgi:hypothetical protein